jgi:hypothetical protein
MEYNRHIPWLWNRPTWLNDGKLLKALQYTIWVLQTNRQTWNQRKIMLARYLVPWNATKELSNVIAYAFEGDILDKVSIILSSRVIYTTNVVIIDHCNQPWLQFLHSHLSCANPCGWSLKLQIIIRLDLGLENN